MAPDTGVVEPGKVTLHAGFNAVGSGGILDVDQFFNADFMADNYKMLSVSAITNSVSAGVYAGSISVTNMAPVNGTCQTPVWVAIHDGSFDTYDIGSPISASMERLAEDGNNGLIAEDFEAAAVGVWDGVVGSAPICPGETAELAFNITLVDATRYFSYASMVIPSNDAFLANGNPMTHEIFSATGEFVPLSFDILGSEVNDAGSEVNDEIPENTAFLAQMEPNTGIVDRKGCPPRRI